MENNTVQVDTFPFELPIKVDRVNTTVNKIFKWTFITAVVWMSVIVVLQMTLMAEWAGVLFLGSFVVVIGLILLFMIWHIISVIWWAVELKKKTKLLSQWLHNVYGINIMKNKQIEPLLKEERKQQMFGYASETALIWQNVQGRNIAVPFALVMTNNNIALYNLNSQMLEPTLVEKTAVHYWEFFWSFSEAIYIPMKDLKSSDVELFGNQGELRQGVDFVDFASPLEGFAKMKIWGEESEFLEAYERNELPYSILRTTSMKRFVSILEYFKDRNLMVEIDFKGNQTTFPVEVLIDAVNTVYSS